MPEDESPWEAEELGMVVRGPAYDAVDSDDVADLPEVRRARDLGWEPAPEAPLWCFLPVVWPTRACAWLPDRRIRHSTVAGSDGSPVRRVPWSTSTHAEIETDYNRLLEECGFPPRPFGRVWLLRPPQGWASVDALLGQVVDTWRLAGGEVYADRRFAEHARTVVARAFGSQD